MPLSTSKVVKATTTLQKNDNVTAVYRVTGFWGETADWDSGVTCVQKTHDSGKEHIVTFSGGKGILLCRNPYEAILSFHNFLYGGHTGFAPSKNFDRKGSKFFNHLRKKFSSAVQIILKQYVARMQNVLTLNWQQKYNN